MCRSVLYCSRAVLSRFVKSCFLGVGTVVFPVRLTRSAVQHIGSGAHVSKGTDNKYHYSHSISGFATTCCTIKINLVFIVRTGALIHVSFSVVDEEGTEAAGSTAVIMRKKRSLDVDNVATFRADHPFVFVIRHRHTGLITFLGCVKNL